MRGDGPATFRRHMCALCNNSVTDAIDGPVFGKTATEVVMPWTAWLICEQCELFAAITVTDDTNPIVAEHLPHGAVISKSPTEGQ